MEERAKRAGAGKVLASASTETLNLVVAGSAAVGAAALASWPVAVLGGLAYAALVAWDVASPSYWKKVLARKPPPSRLPPADRFPDPEVRHAIEALHHARAQLDRVLLEAPASVQGYVGMSLLSIGELEERAGTLARRSLDMGRYLATVDLEQVRRGIARLEEQAAAASDAEARAQFESAKVARQEQLRTLSEIALARERAHANLARITATIEALPAKVIKMQVLDSQAIDAMSGDMNEELDRMNGELRAFEETLAQIPVGANAA